MQPGFYTCCAGIAEKAQKQMTDRAHNPNPRRRFSFLKRGQQIIGHQVGDIHSDEPVTIGNGAVLVGNVRAPKVRVAGMLQGTAVTPELIIETTGQIWGDVFATRLQIEPGGVIQGWVSSPQADPTDAGISAPPPLPPELAGQAGLPRDDAQLEALHHLQAEAGAALAAHAELERQFETRLTEQAGDAFEKVETLTQELADTQNHLTESQEQLEQARAKMAAQASRIAGREADITVAKERDNQQKQQLDAVNQTHEQLTHAFETLTTAKDRVDLTLAQTYQQMDALTDRIQVLEITLQASIQRAAEQEDALVHWQELAETRQSQMEEMEKGRKVLKRQLEESAAVTGKLRDKNNRLEFEWQQTLTALDDLRNKTPDITVEEMQFALANAQQQAATLKNIIAELDEQILWHKANLKTVQRTLEKSRQIARQQEAMLTQLKEKSAKKETAVDKWKTAVEQMATRLQDQENQIKNLTAGLSQKQELLDTATADLEETRRHKSLQLNTYESEIEDHLAQMAAQGQRLAEIQATLIERELQLKQAKIKVAKQSTFIKRMKQVTNDRIKQMETQLAIARQKTAQRAPKQ